MKRYEIKEIGSILPPWFTIKESEDGKWVKWKDVREYINSTPLAKLDSVECNCRENFHDRTVSPSNYYNHWICPAHGYKKI